MTCAILGQAPVTGRFQPPTATALWHESNRLMNASTRLAVLLAPALLSVPACQPAHGEHAHHDEHHTLVATSPQVRDVTVTQQYVGQIRSRRNIEVRPLQEGYLEAVTVREGQAVKAGDLLFAVVPTLYKTRVAAEQAKLQSAQLNYDNTARLAQQNVVSQQEVALKLAELNEARARLNQAETELSFTQMKAPFDGIIDRIQQQQGSLVKKEDVLTTLSDNSVMWVYFNVPEARYLEYMAGGREREARQLELVLADGNTFPHPGAVGAVEAKFNNETGNIPFRADFPNPDRLLRHGQTGNVLIHRTLKDAVVIPQRATFETLDKRYVYVVGKPTTWCASARSWSRTSMDDIFLIGQERPGRDRRADRARRRPPNPRRREGRVRVRCKPDDALAKNQKHHAE